MTVVRSTQDRDTRTVTFVAELAAPPERVWQLWSDPRQLERWWGPPTWPATFEELDLSEGGTARYLMTGPEGERAGGWWRFSVVDEPRLLEFEDGFADSSGRPDPDLPVTAARVDIEAAPGGTLMTVTSRFASTEQMDEVVAMGAVEGMTKSIGQIDELLAQG